MDHEIPGWATALIAELKRSGGAQQPSDGWAEWSKWVLAEIKRSADERSQICEDMIEIQKEFVALRAERENRALEVKEKIDERLGKIEDRMARLEERLKVFTAGQGVFSLILSAIAGYVGARTP